MFLNQTKIDEELPAWRNLSYLAKNRNFLALQNMTSKIKFSFMYDQNFLLENCSVFDIYGSNVTQKEIEEYEKVSEEFKRTRVNKDEFAKMNLTIFDFNPPYVQSRKCKDIAEPYMRTEYKNLSGCSGMYEVKRMQNNTNFRSGFRNSDHLFYLTLFNRPANQTKDDRFKFTKMNNDLLLSLRWEFLVTDNREFGFKIHIHSPDQSPTSKQAAVLGINAQSNKWVTLGYSHSFAKFLKPPFKTNCYNYAEHNFDSRQSCIDTCKLELSKSHCNTLPLYTLLEVEKTKDFINKKKHAECYFRFNIGLYCEQKCYRKDCRADFYTASILSEVGQSQNSLIIDIVKPNTGINQEYNYKQSMKAFELILYSGSCLSLWYGISVYGLPSYLGFIRRIIKLRKNRSETKIKFLRRAKRFLGRSSLDKMKSPIESSNKKINQLSYQTIEMLTEEVNRLENENNLEIKFKDKLGFNYDHNMDYNYCNNLTYYGNQMKNEPIKFIVLNRNQNAAPKF